MPLEQALLQVVGHVQNLNSPVNSPVPNPHSQLAAVAIEGYTCGRAATVIEVTQLAAAGRVPHGDRPVETHRRQPASISSEDHAKDRTDGSSECAQVQLAQAILVIPLPAARVAFAGRLTVGCQ